MPVVPPPFSNLADIKKARPEATYERPRMGEGIWAVGRPGVWGFGIAQASCLPGNGLLTSGGASWPQP